MCVCVCVTLHCRWHGWLHHMYDETPGEQAKEGAEKTVIPTHSASSAALGGINSHVYESNIEHREMVNQTQLRQRGYKVGSLKTGPEDPDQYFMQKSHPLHPEAFSGTPGSRHEVSDATLHYTTLFSLNILSDLTEFFPCASSLHRT